MGSNFVDISLLSRGVSGYGWEYEYVDTSLLILFNAGSWLTNSCRLHLGCNGDYGGSGCCELVRIREEVVSWSSLSVGDDIIIYSHVTKYNSGSAILHQNLGFLGNIFDNLYDNGLFKFTLMKKIINSAKTYMESSV